MNENDETTTPGGEAPATPGPDGDSTPAETPSEPAAEGTPATE